jgi:hypothetical protein
MSQFYVDIIKKRRSGNVDVRVFFFWSELLKDIFFVA